MKKIASPQELNSELRGLLASCEGQPSRDVLASKLRELADRVAEVQTKADFDKLQHQMRADLDTFDLAWSRYSRDPVANKHKLADAMRYMEDLRALADVLIRNMQELGKAPRLATSNSLDGLKVRAVGVFAKGLRDGAQYTLRKDQPFHGKDTYNFVSSSGKVVARFDESQIETFLSNVAEGDQNGLQRV